MHGFKSSIIMLNHQDCKIFVQNYHDCGFCLNRAALFCGCGPADEHAEVKKGEVDSVEN